MPKEKQIKAPTLGMKEFISEYRYFYRDEINRFKAAKILGKFFAYIAKKLLDGHTINFPYRIGNMYITGRAINFAVEALPIGWGTSVNYNERPRKKGEDPDFKFIRMANESENFKIYRVKWTRERYARRARPLDCHKFHLAPANKMKMFYAIKEDDKEYHIRS